MKTATDTTVDAVLPDVEPTDTTKPAEPTDDAARDTGTSPPDTDESWVAKCQRQFSDSDRRLGNLVDGENAVVDGA
ncbi:hypothetical protein [Halobacterium litoreum]|uniref:Uncharacterized protein n=1 Tax=Halobacterium litoreum TaxID=2039234 RepID=A0ABD5NDF5_9EURY|nr:hypothetical protein [Halobacterium litoreum]UHH13918.1 hypothetical protein LT972_02710 [Halobacterium litoreum]